jgi:acetyltransferase-like isoleucine patch superfamily enzyme
MNFIEKIRRRESKFYNYLYIVLVSSKGFTFPRIAVLGYVFYGLNIVLSQVWRLIKNQYFNQIMGIKCESIGKKLQLDGDLPLISGDGQILIGDNVSIGNRQTWVVGLKVYDTAKLIIGNNTTINYQTLISVAQGVTIGENCMLAGEIKIFDNNSHPLDYIERRENKVVPESGVAPVHIDDDVWIGTDTIIMKGVTIGKGAVIGAGSVVTKSIPPFTLAVGNPAVVIKRLNVN